MLSFNLQNFINKFAMPKPMTYRERYDWHTFEDVVSGSCESWNNLVKDVPTAISTLNYIAQDRQNRLDRLSQRYKVSVEEVNKIQQAYIGIDKEYGIYYASVGPYMASITDWRNFYLLKRNLNSGSIPETIEAVKLMPQNEKDEILYSSGNSEFKIIDVANRIEKDLKNNFAIFSKRFCFAEATQVLMAAKNYLVNKMPEYYGLLDLSDLQFELTKYAGMYDEEEVSEKAEEVSLENIKLPAKGRPSKVFLEIYNDLTPNSPALQKIDQDEPIMGSNSRVNINTKGLKKILEFTLKCKQSDVKKEILSILINNPKIINGKDLLEYIEQSANLPPIVSSMKNTGLLMDDGMTKIINSMKSEMNLRQMDNKELLSHYSVIETNPEIQNITDEIYRDALQKVTDRTNKEMSANYTPEQIESALEGNRNLMQAIYGHIRQGQEEHIENNGIASSSLMILPKYSKGIQDLYYRVGQQIPDALQARISQVQVALVKQDIMALKVNNKASDLSNITQMLNESRNRTLLEQGKKAKGKFTSNDVNFWLKQIEEERLQISQEEGRKISDIELLKKYKQEFDTIKNAYSTGNYDGMSNSHMAERAFRERIFGTPGEKDGIPGENRLDADTRAPVTYKGIEDLLPIKTEKFTASQLTEKRQSTGKVTELQEKIEEEIKNIPISNEKTEKKKSKKQLEREERKKEEQKLEENVLDSTKENFPITDDIGSESVENVPVENVPVEDSPVEDFPVEDITQVVPESEKQEVTPINPTQQNPLVPSIQSVPPIMENSEQTDSEKTEEEKRKKKMQEEADNILASSMKNLIKIAKDLENEGKDIESEEIHKVIRKYLN